ncbi:putative wall-associated receptor kinase-like 16 [Miscanthus floridulus]|uniref:putative wall-associated receptor kinase-like 16 n=1 Tax=Miscanthus floridulus TaxID=154761 RepID=UPI0034576832
MAGGHPLPHPGAPPPPSPGWFRWRAAGSSGGRPDPWRDRPPTVDHGPARSDPERGVLIRWRGGGSGERGGAPPTTSEAAQAGCGDAPPSPLRQLQRWGPDLVAGRPDLAAARPDLASYSGGGVVVVARGGGREAGERRRLGVKLGRSAGEGSMQWVVANLSCAEAKQNTSGYACVSINSRCVEVNTSDGYYFGYRCKCTDGFPGNPYIQSGCQGIIIGLSGGFSILLLAFLALFLLRRWRRNVQKQLRRTYFQKNQGLLLEQLTSSDKTNIFSLEELEKATNNFDPTRIIRHGGHGMVYKRILSDQRVVAIKKSLVIEYSEIKQFINEVAILSEINHRNIVKLFGCCLESEVPLLVYDYISNGSLTQVLHDESRNDVSLSWNDYIRIAMEAAGALSYLHSAASISVFHRDVKSSNILLDGNYTAKVSDFGASRLVPVDQTHIVTNVQGTFGYLDPEYFYTRQLNAKSDVYSFGVVLLELLVRKKPIFTSSLGLVQNLSNYFLEALKEREITDIVDPQVAQEATKEEISSIASIAEMCLRLHGEERPTMKQAEMELQILREKQVSTWQSSPENEQQNETILLTRKGKATCQAFATEPGEGANLPLKHNQRCYSLEEEFMESATLPR